jgi:hypothetical protein
MDDLGTRLAEAADRAAQLARAPDSASVWRRVRARRRRRAGGAALALVIAAAVVVLGRGGGLGLPTVDPLGQDRWRHLPWRGLQAGEWNATVPGETPRDPVVVAARGEEAGEPWRLVVYRSTYRPGGRRPPVADVCFILDWFALDPGPPAWQAHGTCAPETQVASALAAGRFGTGGRDTVAVIGRAPAAASRVRLELRGRAPVAAATVAAKGLPGRFYVVLVPRVAHLERMVALDRDGRPVAEAPGQGDLSQELMGYPPTGPVTVVGRATTRTNDGVELVVWPVRDGYCLALEQEPGGGGSECGSARAEPGAEPGSGALDPKVSCSVSSGRPELRLAHGGVPRTARRVRIEAAGARVEVPARDGGEQLGRAFFLAELPSRRPLGKVRITALDAGGDPIRTWRRDGCG